MRSTPPATRTTAATSAASRRPTTRTYQRASRSATRRRNGVVEPDQYGYFNYEGKPRPTLLNWFPDLNTGTFTGQNQGPWTVAGNADYIVYGGEFTTVNGKAQQGLVRFARTAWRPSDGPRLPAPISCPPPRPSPHGVRLSWPANYDRDNEQLTYQLIKDGNTANPVYTTTAGPPSGSSRGCFLDQTVTPGTAVTYRLQVTDPAGNTAGDPVTVTPKGGRALSAYDKAVLDDSPQYYWPLNESSGTTTVADLAGRENGTVGARVTAGVPGAIRGPGTAYRFNGTTAPAPCPPDAPGSG